MKWLGTGPNYQGPSAGRIFSLDCHIQASCGAHLVAHLMDTQNFPGDKAAVAWSSSLATYIFSAWYLGQTSLFLF
jgi:hypothetical protein